MKKILILIFIVFSQNALSGTYLISDAKIIRISSTSSNLDEFMIWTTGGSGPCPGNEGIKFTLVDSGSPEVFNKAYSMALAAFAGDFVVRVHNYHDSTCNRASYIDIKR